MKHATFFLAFFLIIAYLPIFFGKTWYFGDTLALMMPGKLAQVQALRQGIIPFWNPYVLGGQPWFADLNQSLLYPSTLVFFLLPAALALKVVILGHMALTGLGTYLLAKKLKLSSFGAIATSVVWVFSAPIVLSTQNFSILQSATWMPWFVTGVLGACAGERRWKAFLPIVFLLMVLGGHPQPALYAMLFSAIFVFFYPHVSLFKKTIALIIPVLFSIIIGAVVFGPFLELVNNSTRSMMNASDVLSGSLHPAFFLQWLIPNFFSHPHLGMLWGPAWDHLKQADGYSGWIGIVAVILLVLKKQKIWYERACLWTLLVSVVLMIEGYIPGVRRLVSLLPILRVIRTPSMAVFLWSLGSAVAIGSVLSDVRVNWKRLWRLVLKCIPIFIMIAVAVLTFQSWFPLVWERVDLFTNHAISHSSFHTLGRDTVIIKGILTQILASGLFFILLLAVLAKTKVTAKKVSSLRWLVILLIFFDLWFAIWPSIHFAPDTIYNAQSEPSKEIRKRGGVWSAITVNDALPYSGLFSYFTDVETQPPFAPSRFTPQEQKTFVELRNRLGNLASGWNELQGIPTPLGYASFVLKRTADYWKTQNGTNINSINPAPLTDIRYRMLGVRYIIQDLLIYPGDWIVNRYPDLREIAAGDGWKVLEDPKALPFVRTVAEGFANTATIDNVVLNWNTIKFHVTADQNTKITIAQAWFPGWRCIRSQYACTVREQDGWMNLMVPQGDWNIDLNYYPTNMTLWIGVSIFGVLSWIVYVVLLARPAGRIQKR